MWAHTAHTGVIIPNCALGAVSLLCIQFDWNGVWHQTSGRQLSFCCRLGCVTLMAAVFLIHARAIKTSTVFDKNTLAPQTHSIHSNIFISFLSPSFELPLLLNPLSFLILTLHAFSHLCLFIFSSFSPFTPPSIRAYFPPASPYPLNHRSFCTSSQFWQGKKKFTQSQTKWRSVGPSTD